MGTHFHCFIFVFLNSCLVLCDSQYTKKAISAKLNPCHSRVCETGKECRIQERSCSGLQCPLKTTCVDVKQSMVRCFVGKPILDRHGVEKRCQSSRDCSSYTYCVTDRSSERGSLNQSAGCCWRGWSLRKFHVNTTSLIRSHLRNLILRDYAIERASFNFSRSHSRKDFRASHSNFSSVHQPEVHTNHSVSPNFYADIDSDPMVSTHTPNYTSFHASARRGHFVNTKISESQHSNIANVDMTSRTNSQADVNKDLVSNQSLVVDQQTLNTFRTTIEPTDIPETTSYTAGFTNPLSIYSSTVVPRIFRIKPDTNLEDITPEWAVNTTQFENQHAAKVEPLSNEGSLGYAATGTSEPLDYQTRNRELLKDLTEIPSVINSITAPQGTENPGKPLTHLVTVAENIFLNTTITGVTSPHVSDYDNNGKNQHGNIVNDTAINISSHTIYQPIDGDPQTTTLASRTNRSQYPNNLQDTNVNENKLTFKNSFPAMNLQFFTNGTSVNSTFVSELMNDTYHGTGDPMTFLQSQSATKSYISTFTENSEAVTISARMNSSIFASAVPGLTSEIYQTLVTRSNNNVDKPTITQNPALTVNSSLDTLPSLGDQSSNQTLTGHISHHSSTTLHLHRKRRSGYYIQDNYGVNSEGLQQTFPEPGAHGAFGTNEHEPGVEVPLEKPGQCSRTVMGKWSARCMDTCFNDADCPFSQKCCNNGCAKSCQMVTSILNLRSAPSKPGGCPKPGLSGEVSRCFGKTCKTDTECPGRLKCCISLGCGMICKSPNSESMVS